MAFVFKAKKTSSIVLKSDIPGPGEYNSSPENNVEINPVPFLSKASRFHQDVPTYNNQSPFFDTIIQNNGNISLSDHPLLPINDRGTHQKEEPMPSANFVSKVERFNYEDKKKTPGPGAYNQPSFLNKKPKIPNLEITKNTKFKKILPRNKSVPSIPSKVHIHGYNEEWGNFFFYWSYKIDGQLVLNDIPVEEAQEVCKNYIMHNL